MKILLILALAIATVPLNGLALVLLWIWFIVPVFHLPPLTVAQALGLSVTVTFVTSQYTGKDDRNTSERVATILLKPLFALAFGWVVRLFL